MDDKKETNRNRKKNNTQRENGERSSIEFIYIISRQSFDRFIE